MKLVMLPGLDGTGKLFEPLVAHLSKTIEVLVVSYPSDECLGLDELVCYVESKLPEGEFALLAESFSGLVALRLLPKISSRLTCLIFAGGFASSPRPFVLKFILCFPVLLRYVELFPSWLIRALCLGPKASEAMCSWLRGILGEINDAIVLQRLKLISETRFRCEFDVKCPTYYIQALSDQLVPKRASTWFQENVRMLQVLPINAPHFMLQAESAGCAEIIQTCLLTSHTKRQ